ncbi:DUF808 domain-containing protein [Rappaport israeli]|uniref:DUF808 domain-containing protein n=1 Tax=Rappaport israeli TaxID=1839807 RepID=UPI000930FA94|nr:DUF808 domain-containing protein [Rappaport israeli]
MAISFFALFDDIASMMDDVAIITKIATKKTAGVLGDDLALNANQLTGVSAKRELPVVWAVAKGSLLNKVILVPLALLLSAFFPPALPVLLMIGGAYLCYEGVEKVLHSVLHHEEKQQRQAQLAEAVLNEQDLLALEKEKITGAIRTDFVLSAEIIVIAMGVVNEYGLPLLEQAIILSIVAVMMTVFIYGVVAVIVKMDDVGRFWVARYQGILDLLGRFLLWLAPNLIKLLSVVGTLAMFIVGGHIWVEGLAVLHHLHTHIAQLLPKIGLVQWVGNTGFNIAVGAVIGLAIYGLLLPVQRLWHARKA